MSEQIAAPRSTQFSIGRVLADSFRILGRNFIAFIVVSILLHLVWLVTAKPNAAAFLTGVDRLTWSNVVIDPFLGPIIGDFMQLATMFAVLRNLRGEKASTADLVHGVRYAPAVAAAAIIVSLPAVASSILLSVLKNNLFVVGIAMIALGIVAVVLSMMFWVSVQCIASERTGIVAGLRRSAERTKGRRWSIFGLTLILGIMILPVMFAISALGHVPVRELAGAKMTTVPGAIWYSVTILLSALSATVVTVSYHYLRIEKDGFEGKDVVRVFE